MAYKVAYIVGSISPGSINRQLAKALVNLAPPELELVEAPIEQLPFYTRAFDADYPPALAEFKRQIAEADGVLFITPEYNRSIPGVLKNAIDIGSRPYGESAFAGKAAGIVGASGGAVGTAVAQAHLRSMLGFFNAHLMGQPEVYLNFPTTGIEEDGTVTDENTAEFLRGYLDAFAAHVAKHA